MALIGFDAHAGAGKLAGLGTYVSRLLEALEKEIKSSFGLCILRPGNAPDRPWTTPRRLWWENVELPGRAKASRVDLLHVPAFAPPLLKAAKRLVVTVHDLIGVKFPNQMGWPSRFYWGKWLPFAVSRADAIIADSEHTKKDILECLRVEENRVTVIYPSGHEGFTHDIPADEIAEIKKKNGIRAQYFLFVGTLEPRKNIQRVINAFAEFRKHTKGSVDCQLVMTGSKSFGNGLFFKELTASGGLNEKDCIFPDYVGPRELNCLYAGAEALVFPSLYEGFGIPVLEAMASGCPVLTSNLTSTPEVAGDAAILVDPYDAGAIAAGMRELAANNRLRAELRSKGFEQIKKFSWRKTARDVMEVYAGLL